MKNNDKILPLGPKTGKLRIHLHAGEGMIKNRVPIMLSGTINGQLRNVVDVFGR
jgi:hypothetical protein